MISRSPIPFILCITIIFSCKDNPQPGQTIFRKPPFKATTPLDRNLITEDDPTAMSNFTDNGRIESEMYDLRVNNWIKVNAYIYTADYEDGGSTEIVVNPEYGFEAREEALKYATIIGKIPYTLRKGVTRMWIHKGRERIASVTKTILIYKDNVQSYELGGLLEEVLIHEAVHVTLDEDHANSTGWLDAQSADFWFISEYALENPKTEDLAETVLLFLAATYRKDRILAELESKIIEVIPNRIAYLKKLNWEIYPWE